MKDFLGRSKQIRGQIQPTDHFQLQLTRQEAEEALEAARATAARAEAAVRVAEAEATAQRERAVETAARRERAAETAAQRGVEVQGVNAQQPHQLGPPVNPGFFNPDQLFFGFSGGKSNRRKNRKSKQMKLRSKKYKGKRSMKTRRHRK